MSEKIVQLNVEAIKGQLKKHIRGSTEETLNGLLEAEATSMTRLRAISTARSVRAQQEPYNNLQQHHSQHTAAQGDHRHHRAHCRRESSVDETLIEMYLAGVSVRQVKDITEALWVSKVSPSTISELNIEDWRNCPLQGGRYLCVYVDGIYLKRNWGG